MRKFYNSRRSVVSSILLLMLMAACGMVIDKVELSSDNIEQNGTVTVTTTYVKHDDQSNNQNIYLFYGVRVPEDWTNENMLKGVNTYTGGTADYEFTTSVAYGKLLEMCYPRDGYKWIAFESIKPYDVECSGTLVADVTLRAGEKMGNYNLDIISGVFNMEPSRLLNEDGSLNLNVAFGHKIDGNGASEKKPVNGQDTYSVSEYLMLATTITPAEKENRSTALLDKKITVDGVELPLSPVDIGNALDANKIKQLNLDVTVSKSTGLESVASDDTVSVVAGDGCVYVSADGGEAVLYDMAGRIIDRRTISGEVVLNARNGVNVVVVTNNGKKTVRKVMVK